MDRGVSTTFRGAEKVLEFNFSAIETGEGRGPICVLGCCQPSGQLSANERIQEQGLVTSLLCQ